jgi:hypothetical protein
MFDEPLMGKPKIVGYGILGPEEPYLDATLDNLASLCDEVIICGNNATQQDEVTKRGFHYVEDNREWGKLQWRIKEDFVKNHVAKLKPQMVVCVDMDEVFDKHLTKEGLYELYKTEFDAFYFWVINLWDDGYNRERTFPNVRAWKFKPENGFEWKQTPVHCGLAPKWAYYYGFYSPYILKHYGLKDKERREEKAVRYDKYDPDSKFITKEYYQSLRSEATILPFDEDALHEEAVKAARDAKQKAVKPRKDMKEEIAYVKSKNFGVIAVPKRKLQDYLKQGHEYVGDGSSMEETINEVLEDNSPSVGPQDPNPVVESIEAIDGAAEVFVCGQCQAKFDSKKGLRGHTMGAHQNQHIKAEESKKRWSWQK